MSDLSLEKCIEALSAIGVPPAAKLVQYMSLLLDWNEKINLTGAKAPEDFALKHIADVWGAVNQFEPAVKVVDVGSGGGVPGIVLAILRPATDVTLVERRGKKAKVLANIVSKLGMERQIKVRAGSFEEIYHSFRDAEYWFRGFLPGPKFATYLSEFFPHAKLGQLVLMKGPAWPQEKLDILSQAKVKQEWVMRFAESVEVPYVLPRQAGSRMLALV